MTADGRLNWCEFANAVVEETRHSSHAAAWPMAATGGRPLIVRFISPVTTAGYPTPALRRAYSVLSNLRLKLTFGIQLPDWRTQLHAAVRGEEGQ